MDTTFYIIYTLAFIILNVFSYYIFKYDKYLAKKSSNSRISERFFMTISLFGGSLGIYISMFKNRHKTKHLKFRIGIPILLISNVLLYMFLLHFIRSIYS